MFQTKAFSSSRKLLTLTQVSRLYGTMAVEVIQGIGTFVSQFVIGRSKLDIANTQVYVMKKEGIMYA